MCGCDGYRVTDSVACTQVNIPIRPPPASLVHSYGSHRYSTREQGCALCEVAAVIYSDGVEVRVVLRRSASTDPKTGQARNIRLTSGAEPVRPHGWSFTVRPSICDSNTEGFHSPREPVPENQSKSPLKRMPDIWAYGILPYIPGFMNFAGADGRPRKTFCLRRSKRVSEVAVAFRIQVTVDSALRKTCETSSNKRHRRDRG